MATSNGSLTVTMVGWKTIKQLSLDWESDATGAVTRAIGDLNGELRTILFVPDSGATTPTDDYDVTITQEEGVDVLVAKGADLASNAGSMVAWNTYAPPFVFGTHTLNVTNAGASNGGTILLQMR